MFPVDYFSELRLCKNKICAKFLPWAGSFKKIAIKNLRCALIGQKFGIANQNENFFTELAPGPKLNFGSVIISHN